MQNRTTSQNPFSTALVVHLLIYAALVTGLLVLFPDSGSFSSDDGAYAGQVFAVQHQDWALDRAVVTVAPENEGWINTYISSDGPLPYVRHPAYVYLLLGSSTLFGDTYGLGVPSAIGAVLCVFAAWLLTTEYDRRSAPAAFWIVGLSPLLINATTFWGHTIASGLVGLGLWAAVRAAKARSSSYRKVWLWGGLVGVTNAAAIFIRTEAVLWFAGLVIGLTVLNRSRHFVGTMGVALIPAIGAFIADRWWSQSILNQYEVIDLSAPEEAAWLGSRVPAGFHLLLSPSDGAGALFVVVGLCLLVYGAVKFRIDSQARLATRLLVVGGSLFVIPVVNNPSTITGLVSAWPLLLVAGIVGFRASSTQNLAPTSWLYVPMGILTVLVLATQYAGGGGLEWGARYLSTGFVGIGVWAALNLRDLLARTPSAVLAIVCCPAFLGLVVTYQYHSRNADFVAAATAYEPEVVIANQPAATRIAWASLPTSWYTADEDNIVVLLDQVIEADVKRITVVGFDGFELDTPRSYNKIEESDSLVHFVAD